MGSARSPVRQLRFLRQYLLCSLDPRAQGEDKRDHTELDPRPGEAVCLILNLGGLVFGRQLVSKITGKQGIAFYFNVSVVNHVLHENCFGGGYMAMKDSAGFAERHPVHEEILLQEIDNLYFSRFWPCWGTIDSGGLDGPFILNWGPSAPAR